MGLSPFAIFTALVFWTALWFLLRVFVERSNWTGVNRRMMNHLIGVQLPITAIFLLLSLRSILDEDLQRYLTGGSFVLVTATILGRYQYIRYILLGDYYKAYSSPWEWVALSVGISGFILVQQFDFAAMDGISFDHYIYSAFSMSSGSPLLVVFYWLILAIDGVFLWRQQLLFNGRTLNLELVKSLHRVHLLSFVGFFFRMTMVVAVTLGLQKVFMGSTVTMVIILSILLNLLRRITLDELPEWYDTNYELQQERERRWENILFTVQRQKIYLNANLTAEEWSIRLNIDLSSLRDAIKEKTELTIPTFLNMMRLHEFLKIAYIDPNPDMEALMKKSGFASKSTLVRTAKLWFDDSPRVLISNKIRLDLDSVLKN